MERWWFMKCEHGAVVERCRNKRSTRTKACLSATSSTEKIRALDVSFDSCYLLTHIKLDSSSVIKSLDK